MQNKQMDPDHISGWWRRTWTTMLNFAKALETSPTDYMFDRIAHLEREVASLKSELQTAQAQQRHPS